MISWNLNSKSILSCMWWVLTDSSESVYM